MGLKFSSHGHSAAAYSKLKSDQNGIEIIFHRNILFVPSLLKSDQNGIEIDMSY